MGVYLRERRFFIRAYRIGLFVRAMEYFKNAQVSAALLSAATARRDSAALQAEKLRAAFGDAEDWYGPVRRAERDMRAYEDRIQAARDVCAAARSERPDAAAEIDVLEWRCCDGIKRGQVADRMGVEPKKASEMRTRALQFIDALELLP